MGCFNVACSVSNLSIGASTRVAFIPLWPNVFPRESQNHLLIPEAHLIYSHHFYYPVCLPIFGEYDDYGGIENIECNENVDLIEKYFGMPIDSFIEFITSGRRGVADSYGVPVEVFCEPNKKEWVSGHGTIHRFGKNWLTAMGFHKIDKPRMGFYKEFKFVHPSSDEYLVGIYKADYKGYKNESFIIFDAETGVEIVRGGYHSPRSDFLKKWYNLTGYILYVSEENQELVKTMSRMAGMFVHGDIWKAIINNSNKMELWWAANHKPENLWLEFDRAVTEYEESKREFDPVDTSLSDWRHPLNSMGNNTRLPLYFRGWPFFRPIYEKTIMDGGFREEINNWITFQSGMHSCNRFFFPAMNGEQHGNLSASRFLAEESLKILKAEWEKYKEDGDTW